MNETGLKTSWEKETRRRKPQRANSLCLSRPPLALSFSHSLPKVSKTLERCPQKVEKSQRKKRQLTVDYILGAERHVRGEHLRQDHSLLPAVLRLLKHIVRFILLLLRFWFLRSELFFVSFFFRSIFVFVSPPPPAKHNLLSKGSCFSLKREMVVVVVLGGGGGVSFSLLVECHRFSLSLSFSFLFFHSPGYRSQIRAHKSP